jgi:hypothetical protein
MLKRRQRSFSRKWLQTALWPLTNLSVNDMNAAFAHVAHVSEPLQKLT